MRVRVVCGLLETMAIFSLSSVFSSVDFPTFGHPMIATVPDFIVPTTLMYGHLISLVILYAERKNDKPFRLSEQNERWSEEAMLRGDQRADIFGKRARLPSNGFLVRATQGRSMTPGMPSRTASFHLTSIPARVGTRSPLF